MTRPKTLLGWSGGKDSTWALHLLREAGEYEVSALVTTVNSAFDRVAIHGTRLALVERQAEAAGLPLWPVLLPWPCSNADYESAMTAAIRRAVTEGFSHFAFGDLFLEDIRAYREQQLEGTGLAPLFPCWGLDTTKLAGDMLRSGLRARLTCVDLARLPASFAGRAYDMSLLADLPPGTDPCGERGEFHTFCEDAPCFAFPIDCRHSHTVERDGYAYAELLEAAAGQEYGETGAAQEAADPVAD